MARKTKKAENMKNERTGRCQYTNGWVFAMLLIVAYSMGSRTLGNNKNTNLLAFNAATRTVFVTIFNILCQH